MKSRADEIFENCLTIEKLCELPTQGGLVLFADSQDAPILLMTTANIRRNVKNKLAEQKESKRTNLKSITAKIYYTICPCKFRLALVYHQAVKKIFPSNYKDHETIVWPAFIKMNLNEKIPFFSVTRKPTRSTSSGQAFGEGEKILGPFPRQKAAVVFLNALEDAFKLCKRNDLVDSPQRAAGCPYLQMDACCGVCSGKISVEDYQVIVKNAFEAGAKPIKTIEQLQQQMQVAAKELNFELADELKRKIEKLSTLKKQAYKWTGDLEKLKIIHIDKSARIKPQGSKRKKQTLRPRSGQAFAFFVMNFFEIIDLGDFVIETTEKVAEAIEKSLAKLNGNRQEICDSTETIEQFAIVSYFLYRTKLSGLWINVCEGFDKTAFVKTVNNFFFD